MALLVGDPAVVPHWTSYWVTHGEALALQSSFTVASRSRPHAADTVPGGLMPEARAVSVLKSEGMVEGTPDPNDGRQTVLSLTAKCRQTIAAARAAKKDWLFRTLQSKLTAAEQHELAGAVVLLDRLIEP